MPKFDAEPRERCKCVDDEATAIAGVMVMIAGIGIRLDRAADAGRVCDSFVFSPGMCLPHVCTGSRIAEGTASKCLLHHSPPSSVSRAERGATKERLTAESLSRWLLP
jgi:hypothetical protein